MADIREGLRLGNTGLQQWGGRIDEEWHRQLRGEQGVRVFREMAENESTISGILLLIEYLVRGVSIGVEPASSSAEAMEAADFLDSCIQDLGAGAGAVAMGESGQAPSAAAMSALLSEFCSTLIFGWSYFEEVYKLRRGDGDGLSASSRYDDGRLGWADFEIRAQDTLHHWEIEERNGNRVAGMWQQTLPDWHVVFIPIEKAVHFRTRSHKGNPEGKSFLRGVYRAWYLKKRIEEIEAIGIERDLVGLPTLTVPPRLLEPGASAEDAAFVEQLKTMVSEVRRDEREGLVLPAEETADIEGKPVKTGYKFSLLASGGTRTIDTNSTIARYREDIARGLLHHFWSLGSGPSGSRALSSDLTDLSALAVGSILDVFVDTLNAQSVPRLMRLNGFPQEVWPRVTHGDIEKAELDKVGSFLSSMVTSAVITPDAGLERFARKLAGAPAIGEDLVGEGGGDEPVQPDPAEEPELDAPTPEA